MKKAKNAVQPGAPALEKGLDLLEALAAEARGLSQKQLAERVGRSVGEIFRMLVALERRGYVTRDPVTGEYTLTLKLFRIASQFPPTERLLQAALPVMEQLAGRVQLSCHLTVLHGEQFMVIARIEPEWLMGWSVKVGAVFPLTQQYASAKVLAAFQLEGRARNSPMSSPPRIASAARRPSRHWTGFPPRAAIFPTTTAIPAFSLIAVRSSKHRGGQWRP